MAEVIKMPRLSDTMEEGTVAQWLKQKGDKVEEGDILAEIETDKATIELSLSIKEPSSYWRCRRGFCSGTINSWPLLEKKEKIFLKS